MVLDIVFKGKSYTTREVVIKTKEIEFDKDEVDSKNVVLKKVKNPKANGERANVFVYEDGTVAKEHFKAIGGVAKKGFKKTTLVNEDKIKRGSLIDELRKMVSNDHTYYLVNDEFKKELQLIGVDGCLVFKPYMIREFKAYKGVVYYHEDKDRVILKLIRSDLTEVEMPETSGTEQVEAGAVGGIDEADVVC